MVTKVNGAKDAHYLDGLRSAWQEFGVIKDQNAKWMLDGEYDKAKEALIAKGRSSFKKAMDLAAEWMEARN